jgi:glycerol 3-phosphatase-2
MHVLVDLDGVVWLTGEAIPGAAEGIELLRSAGWRVTYVTNNSGLPEAELCQRLEKVGIEADPGDVVSSAMVAASLLEPGTRAFVIGGEGLRAALSERGVALLAPEESERAEVVVVGIALDFTYGALRAAAAALHRGARLLATNTDPTFPTPSGLIPGAGALVAAVETAGLKKAEVAGKPHEPVARYVSERRGRVDLVIGDRASTDGLLAERLSARFGLVRSGVTPPGAVVEPAPDLDAPDLRALAETLVADGLPGDAASAAG